jgi:hypothetical protein
MRSQLAKHEGQLLSLNINTRTAMIESPVVRRQVQPRYDTPVGQKKQTDQTTVQMIDTVSAFSRELDTPLSLRKASQTPSSKFPQATRDTVQSLLQADRKTKFDAILFS